MFNDYKVTQSVVDLLYRTSWNQKRSSVTTHARPTLSLLCYRFNLNAKLSSISCFPVGHREILVKIFFDLTLVPPVKIPVFMFLLPR